MCEGTENLLYYCCHDGLFFLNVLFFLTFQSFIEPPEMTKAEKESNILQLKLPQEYSGSGRCFRGLFAPHCIWDDKWQRSSKANDNDVRQP